MQGVSRTITFAGFPLSSWAFAPRIWVAMMVALYAAFWLQLESASSAAVTVGILARQTRGQVYQKAVYRVLTTVIGVAASFVIAGLFPQSRSPFVIGFAGWLGLWTDETESTEVAIAARALNGMPEFRRPHYVWTC